MAFKHASPLVKGLAALSAITMLYVGINTFYKPYVRRQRLKRNEEFANIIIEQMDREHKEDK